MKYTHPKKVLVIGAGFSGLSAANYLAKEGFEVSVYEKHDMSGGRARQFSEGGFKFDMGPTWYWMPDVFEKFFADFNKKTIDYYRLQRLDPGYKVFFGEDDFMDIPEKLEDIYNLFEREESGGGKFLKRFLKHAEYNYKVAMDKVVYMPGKSPLELISVATVSRLGQFISSITQMVRSGVKSERLRQILEFPVLFLGAKPEQTPAFYCFMNYADMVLGTWYPQGGMYSVVSAFEKLAEENGVSLNFNANVEKIVSQNGMVKGVVVNGKLVEADAVVSGADYYHTETLLDIKDRNYSESYWNKKVFAPSALLFYVGFNKKLKNLAHHTLFFDTSFKQHAISIYDDKVWPENPLFYASFPSLTDRDCSPLGSEAAIFLIPIATGLTDSSDMRNKYFDEIMDRLEKITQQSVKDNVVLKRSYCVNDFKRDYNAYGGNAYGLSNILKQTAFLKPKLQNKKLTNMFYTGQLTVPGPGVPPAIISGKIVSGLVTQYLNKKS
ncbi:phytoene desaturase family protein [Saccharicrinis fermentans]|uniref:Dehydrosqualene desaturase n=1 Tax=Saccharicrinis fermentans DSM 9555 = JCM 21142 TaxID=869213 RepID=W7Y511_9BACT|nr:phytoene desaturase family protein [Saccharicrinis fermentans]GAF03187.1 dehydrosqualene desaturase [Saccharicrinis fermentans DSM 9555 = JCM 21142]